MEGEKIVRSIIVYLGEVFGAEYDLVWYTRIKDSVFIKMEKEHCLA